MTCSHRWRTIYQEGSVGWSVEWQICVICGNKRYAATYRGYYGQMQTEEHPWPENVPAAVADVLAIRSA